MFYTIYKITNTLDGKIYIGKHQTKDLNDGYMGSGKRLRYAIEKYGIENFTKEILFQFDNEADMNAKETELVTEEFCLREDTYNLCVGGKGGFGYINTNVVNDELKIKRAKSGRKKADETVIEKYGSLKYIYDKFSKAGPIAVKEKYKNNADYREKHQENLKKARKLAHSESATEKRKNTFNVIGHSKGSKNSQYGTMWITDGTQNQKIKRDDPLPDGWKNGRTLFNNNQYGPCK